MPYILYLNDEPVAYVNLSKNKTVVEKKRASLIEPCLMAYGISINMGVDESVSYPRRIEGFPLKIHNSELDENTVVKAIEICLGFISGIRPTVEEVEEKIYEVTRKEERVGGENKYEEVEFERA